MNAFSLLGAARAPGRGHDREPTAAGPGAAGTHDVPERPEQPREREGERPTERSPAPGGRDRTPRPRATGDALPLEGQTFSQAPGPNLSRIAFAPEPSAQSAHFSGEMSERKEGRGKGKGKKKDRGSGKKPAPADGGEPTLPPRLKEMKSQESAAGSKLVLRCETSSEYSSLRFKWFKNGNELNRKNKPQNIKIQKSQGNQNFASTKHHWLILENICAK